MSEWFGRTSVTFRESEWWRWDETSRGRIETFAADVLRFGRSRNLVSRVDPEGEVARLIEESVLAGALLRSGSWARLLDIGSGAGFPGVIIASLFPERTVILSERRQGRGDFLERAVAHLGLRRARVAVGDVRSMQEPRFDRVTGKAVTEVGRFLGWCDDLLADDGRVVLFQRSGWAGIEGWETVDTVVTLRDRGSAGDRIATLLRRDVG